MSSDHKSKLLEENAYEKRVKAVLSEHKSLVLKLARIALYRLFQAKGKRLTGDDLRDRSYEMLRNAKEGEPLKKQCRAILREIYIASIKDSNNALKIYEYLANDGMFDPAAGDDSEKRPALTNAAFKKVVLLLENLQSDNPMSALRLAVPLLDIDISEEALAAQKLQEAQLDETFEELKLNQEYIKNPQSLIQRLSQSEQAINLLKGAKSELTESIKEFEKENQSTDASKSRWITTVVVSAIALLVIAFLLNEFIFNDTSTRIESPAFFQQAVLSEPFPISVEETQQGMVLIDESGTEPVHGFDHVSLRLANFSADTTYFLDAVLLNSGLPANTPKRDREASHKRDSVHFLLGGGVTDHSINVYAKEGATTKIAPRTNSFMEILVGGQDDLKGLEVDYEISIVVHNQFSQTDTITFPNRYVIRF